MSGFIFGIIDKYMIGLRTFFVVKYGTREMYQIVNYRVHFGLLSILLCRGFAPTVLPTSHFQFNNPLGPYFKDFKDMTRGWLSETVTTYLRTPVTSKPGTVTPKYHVVIVADRWHIYTARERDPDRYRYSDRDWRVVINYVEILALVWDKDRD